MTLSKQIAKHFGQELGNVNFQRYNDGEFQPSFEESVRGSRVFLIGSTNPSSDNLMRQKELLLDISQLLFLILAGQDKIEKINLEFL